MELSEIEKLREEVEIQIETMLFNFTQKTDRMIYGLDIHYMETPLKYDIDVAYFGIPFSVGS